MNRIESPFTDAYEEEIKKCSLNAAARKNCIYRIWPDQSEAKEGILKSYNCIILDPSADGGMPHTRAPGIICFPAYYPKERLGVTLRHELIHIDQRLNKDKWRKRLLDEGWTEESESEVPLEWRRRCRLNPDTLECRFVAWEGRYIPLPIFEREDKPHLRDIQIRWWDKKEKRILVSAPTTYVYRYGIRGKSEMEHPYELWAYDAEGRD
jgi:hypothetical protein